MLHRISGVPASARDFYGLADAIAATIDAKDGYTHHHSSVSRRCRAVSRSRSGLSDDQQRTVQLAALLHDVGKIAVPDAILKKPGRLTAEEFAEMKKHPMHGVRILANIQGPAVAAVLPGVRYHHERWDGTGYPDGLRGDHIPLLGRLLGVADFYDAVTSARPYRPAIPQAEAITMIVNGAGSHFDPEIVKAVMRLYQRGDLLPSTWKHLLPMRDAALAAPVPARR
jgi:putative two-component system response regulator